MNCYYSSSGNTCSHKCECLAGIDSLVHSFELVQFEVEPKGLGGIYG